MAVRIGRWYAIAAVDFHPCRSCYIEYMKIVRRVVCSSNTIYLIAEQQMSGYGGGPLKMEYRACMMGCITCFIMSTQDEKLAI